MSFLCKVIDLLENYTMHWCRSMISKERLIKSNSEKLLKKFICQLKFANLEDSQLVL